MKTTEIIKQQIDALVEGTIFTYADLGLPITRTASGAKTMSRLVAIGKLRRVGKGKFYKPKQTRLGELPPLTDELIRDLIYDRNNKQIGYITGIPAFSQLGLTTQISSKIIIGSANYRRPLRRAGYEISYTKQLNAINEKTIPLLRILDAMKFIKRIPATTTSEVTRILVQLIKELSAAEVRQLTELAKSYTPSVKALLGAILEIINKPVSDLMNDLNPFTNYKLGIAELVLPNKLKWNIL